MEKMRRNWIGLVLLFLLCLPIFKNALVSPKEFSSLENRVLTTTIKWDQDMFKSGVLAERVENFVQDQFPLRDTFVNLKSDTAYLLGRKENNGVYIGKDGYLFGKQTGQTEIFSDNLDAVMTLSKHLSQEITLLTVPASGLIYEDKLPYGVDAKEQRETVEEFKKAVDGKGNYIDLFALFQKHRNEDIYFKTDHHWTPYGAYLSYEALMERFSLDPILLDDLNEKIVEGFYGTYYSKFRGNFVKSEPFTYYDFEDESLKIQYTGVENKESRLFFEEYLEERDKYKIFLGGNDPLVTLQNQEASYEEKILVLKDSYANAMIPYLVETFQEVHLMDLRYYNASLKDYLAKEEFDRVILLYGMDSYLEQRQLRNLGY